MTSSRRWLVGAAATALLSIFLVPATASAGQAQPTEDVPHIWAKSWLIADATTGDVLAAKNPHLRLRPASTLKTLTAITLLPRLDKRAEYKVQWADAAVEGSAVGIVPGATYTINDLFYGMLLPSGNDAAHALANAAGGIRSTVSLMNAEAKSLHAKDTTVTNPSGLDAPHQFTSAYDLALFSQEGLQRSDFRRYVSTVSRAFPAEMPKKGKHRKTYQIYNQNPLLINGYRGILGVKTGYTTLAGRTYVGAAERGGHTLIVTMMGVVESTETAAQTLLNWGFAHAESTNPVATLDHSKTEAHNVRAAVVVPTPPLNPINSARGGAARWWLFSVGAGICLAGWLGVRRFLRRPRRPALPSL